MTVVRPEGPLESREPTRAQDPSESPAEAARRQIAEEHRALQQLLERLKTTSDLPTLHLRLAELGELLGRHFAREEAPEGLHRAIDGSAPRLTSSVQRLFEEHREYLAELDELAEKARALAEGPTAEVRREVAELCDRLHEHEVSETLLLAGALYDDLGGGD